MSPGRRRRWPGRLALLLVLAGSSAQAQEFSRYLSCTGSFSADGQRRDAHADFALRFNGRTALVQSSNILPVGERLPYVATPANYSMAWRLRPQGTQVLVVPGWFQSTILVAHPNLRRLNQIRLSINRQDGGLEGTMLNEEEVPLAAFNMQCRSHSESDLGTPKF